MTKTKEEEEEGEAEEGEGEKKKKKTKEEEEILVIDDEENSDEFTNDEILLCYEGHIISSHDYSTLEVGEFLNDSVIDFYLAWLLKEKVSQEKRHEIHVFSSHFFSRLISKPSKSKSVQAFERDPNKTKEEKAYLRVKGWTKKLDIFSKKLLIVPICHNHHWFMVLICNPGNINLEKEEQIISGEPFIVVLDSFGNRCDSGVSALRSYLEYEYLEKKKIPLSFGTRAMRVVYPRLPLQMNSFDCGVFLLEYAERIIQKSCFFMWPSLPDLSEWFTLDEISTKRSEIAQLVRNLCQKKHPEKFPSLSFPPISFSSVDVEDSVGEIDEDAIVISDDNSPPIEKGSTSCRINVKKILKKYEIELQTIEPNSEKILTTKPPVLTSLYDSPKKVDKREGPRRKGTVVEVVQFENRSGTERLRSSSKKYKLCYS